MSKPSIFSSDYEKKMKRRKKRKIVFFTLLTIIFLITFLGKYNEVFFQQSRNFKNMVIKMLFSKKIENINSEVSKEDKNINNKVSKEDKNINDYNNTKVNNNEKNKLQENEKNIEENIETEENENLDKEEKVNFTLGDGQNIEIIFNIENNDKRFKSISGSNKIQYDINPARNGLVVFSMINQDITYIDIKMNKKDITKRQYVSTSKKIYSKDHQLKKNPKYIWHSAPKFVDDYNLVYISELPWMNEKHNKYVWIYNMKNNKHININAKVLYGKTITFKKEDKENLDIFIDNKKYTINSSGKIINKK